MPSTEYPLPRVGIVAQTLDGRREAKITRLGDGKFIP